MTHDNPHGIYKGQLVLVNVNKKYRNNRPFYSRVKRIFRNQFWVEDTSDKFWLEDLSHYRGDYTISIQEWMPCHTYKQTYKRENEPMMTGVPWNIVENVVRRIEGTPIWFFGKERNRKCKDLTHEYIVKEVGFIEDMYEKIPMLPSDITPSLQHYLELEKHLKEQLYRVLNVPRDKRDKDVFIDLKNRKIYNK